MSHTLTGKKIVVTGGSRGIGADVIRSLAAQGPAAIVIGYASRKDAADALIEEVRQNNGTEIILASVGGALGDQASAQAFAKSALEALGGELDILINVAGVMKQRSLSVLTQSDYDEHFRKWWMTLFLTETLMPSSEANVSAPLFLTQALAPHIRPEGRILFFSTSLTTHPIAIGPGYLPYVATKGAVEQMTRVLARDPSLSGPDRRITINVVSPGPTETELFREGKSQALLDTIAGHHPSKRIGQPHEVRASSWHIFHFAHAPLSRSPM
jgi:3-oxoacyl-[acyl-carrier protein] reductase